MSIQNRVVKVNHIRDFEGGIMKDTLILRSIMMKIRNMFGIKYGLRIFKPVLLPLIMP